MNTSPPPRAEDDPPTVRNFVNPASSRASTRTPLPPTAAAPTIPTRPALPDVGSEFLGFRLVGELGRGAFGRVYLATQGELAGRPVALKVTPDVAGDSRSLAQLQHTNIVPVYSVHHDRGLHAVCMPYFGRTTLADLLRRLRGSRPGDGAGLVDLLRGMTAAQDGKPFAPLTPAATAHPRTDAVYDRLRTLTFPQAVCWMIGRVADGLAHAHDRGIVHRDVKPANVLLTDDGQPMLLDFGVSADLKQRANEAPGGTVPYMAPEQLAHLFSDTPPVDPRGDVYSLGVILFEWLTGGHPFSPPAGDLEADLPRLLDERQRWAPRLRGVVPDVTADLESVVRTCTAADPARRYQSAADVSEDLRRVLAFERLRVAPEPGGWSAVVKWRKRNPKLGGQLLVIGGVLAGLGLCGGAAVAWKGIAQAEAEHQQRAAAMTREQERIDAVERLLALQSEVRAARYHLSGRVNELRTAPADLTRVRQALEGYGLPDDADWRTRPPVATLTDGQRVELFTTISDACLLLARDELQEADGEDAARSAERWNTLAEVVRPGDVPRAVFSQRATILTRLGRTEEATAAGELAAATPLLTAEDHFLSGDEFVAYRKYADAAPLLREAIRLDPTHFWAQCNLGACHHHLGRASEARACYSAAVALRPDVAWVYFNRAMATVPLMNHPEVAADLDVVITLDPTNAPARLHRGHARAMAGDRAKGMADLDAVLAAPDPGGMHVRAYLQRAKWRKASGDAAGADADVAAALPLRPTDEIGWLLRGLARADADPAAALGDIEQAVRLNPQYVTALRNQVFVLEKLKRYDDAAEVMEKVIPLAKGDMVLLVSRGLLHARLGRADDAVRDVTAALASDRRTHVRMAAATTYALLARTKPDSKAEAMRLLVELKKDGHSLVELKADPDFSALHDDPDFRRLTGGG